MHPYVSLKNLGKKISAHYTQQNTVIAFLKALLPSKYSYMLWYWGLGLQHMSVDGK